MDNVVNVEEVSSTEYKLSINVSAVGVDKKFDDFFNTMKSQIVVPGFRKGKAPLSRLKQLFGQKARPTVTQMIIGEYYTKALQEKNIVPIGSPRIDNVEPGAAYPGKFGIDNSYSVDLMIEVLPKIDPQGYYGMKLEFPKHDADSMFNQKMQVYQERFSEKIQVINRGAQFGDSLVIDFVGYIDDQQLDGGAADNHQINSLGNDKLIPGFEQQIVGIKAGETKEINVTFPIEYPAAHLAGKNTKFKVTVHSIIEKKLAEINNDLAIMAGFKSVDELNEHIKNEVEADRKHFNKIALDRQIVSKLIEINPFDVPKSMVRDEESRLIKISKNKMENLPENAKNEITKLAEFNVKRAILMDAIYGKESSVEVTPEELNKMLEEHAKINNQTKDDLVSSLYNSGQMNNFIGVLRVANVLDYIIEHSNNESEVPNDNQ